MLDLRIFLGRPSSTVRLAQTNFVFRMSVQYLSLEPKPLETGDNLANATRATFVTK
jgi:hypothetical protein